MESRTIMTSEPSYQSRQDQILALSDTEVRVMIPAQLRETGLYTDTQIDRTVQWLIEYRALNRLDVID